MENTSTCKLDFETKKRLDFAGKCIKTRQKEPHAFYKQQYIINKLIDEYLDKIGIDPMPEDITEHSVKFGEDYLKSKRIDVNLKKVTKEDLKGLSKALLKRKMVDRKLNYDDVVVLLMNKYLELYPQLADDLLEFRYINQKMGMKELQEQNEKKKYGIDY
jgi:proline dehydrogenase